MTTDVESLDDKQQKSVRLHAQYVQYNRFFHAYT